MASTHQAAFNHHACSSTDLPTETVWNPEFSAYQQPWSILDTWTSPVQPMQRYLQERDRPFFMSNKFEEDPTMQPFPDVPVYGLRYVDSEGSLQSLPCRYPSPSESGISMSHPSSVLSDREMTPNRSPHVKAAVDQPQAMYTNMSFLASGGYSTYERCDVFNDGHCVALHDVQQYADAQPESVHYDDEHLAYGHYAQEGYHPMHDDVHTEVSCSPSQLCNPGASDGNVVASSEAAPVIRRRRASSTRAITSPYLASKVVKRPSPGKRTSSHDESNTNSDATLSTVRPFPCAFAQYGCTSSFGSKNEWKRHVATQHMRLGYWRCDQCPNSERKPNDFNRKDLFIQHVRRMHPVPRDDKKSPTKVKTQAASGRGGKVDAEEEALGEISRRCYKLLRSAPQRSGCLFAKCAVSFDGSGSWDERMEHIGRHMETAKKVEGDIVHPTAWRLDEVTEAWLLSEQIIAMQKGRLVLA
ncbi:hypothetical protein BAUCODRAFT_36821 [Baudoinia panamericana UAMH 10762]|uniref:C2H2-type domain-containing protein n=1 Tax=Baudoinia panamericana (strain UAMH 10762) TaxID=717646 RepID=M2LGG2_BAUPA|nr:uncharacterized protein BAUCODRAFT_36821 [Baudoinia panamericana UAMH 10762]EMC93157.1 hypothetical protein BAUCODRAFT_36821 [Baudoinia panamericana UAMH 10762]